MTDKNQTSDLPDAHGGCIDVTASDVSAVDHGGELYLCDNVKTTAEDEVPIYTATGRLEENLCTGLINVKEEDETDDMNSQTEIHSSLPADEDNSDIVKVEITEDLCVRQQPGAPDEEMTSGSISPGCMDVTPSDCLAVNHGGEPYVCDHLKTEEDEVPINTATGKNNNKISCLTEETDDQWLRNMIQAPGHEICDNICSGSFTNCNNPSHGQTSDASFNLFQNQRSHVGNVCSVCQKCFTQKSALITHQKTHTGEKAFVCSECGKCFTWKSQLITHQKTHTGEKGFLCTECGKCFTWKSQLISHLKIHTGEKAFSCSHCGKCFTKKSNLIDHLKIHTGEKAFSCSVCGKCFTQKSVLIMHLKIHSGEKAFSCSECGKCFTQKSVLIAHLKIHTGEKEFSCSVCGKSFTWKSQLISHQTVHTGEKAFSCSECGKCFTLKSQLITHQKIHTREKAFSCSECEKSYTQKSALITHQKIHTGEKCNSEICGLFNSLEFL
ncbi:gastrula zinc finger protein XlCGF57.1-like [Bombina bombina]|uniref:gastrula zinc finger protein XlCGF57.1-like n=1 Tax=Bombina bombina TaxID=8345 RepID=UPI00235A4C13|nr:gastrula zinc finger protein XlCGF57.1-like [Bombina bombina]